MDYPEESDKSKSQIKRELLALRDLGRTLVELPEKHLLKIPLPDHLRGAIREARPLSRGARQRQIRYIGGLLPAEDIGAIEQAVNDTLYPSREAVEHFHLIEKWRDALLSGGDAAINDFIVKVPAAERQQLRNLVRNAHKEIKGNKSPRSARVLFGYLKDLLESTP